MIPRHYHVQTTRGSFELHALTQAQAVSTALELAGPGARLVRVWLELAGPGARLVRVWREGEW